MSVMSYEQAKEAARFFIRSYVTENEFFTGGDILEAFRASGLPGSDMDWRNRWGNLITAGHRAGLYIRSGRAAPTSSQSHTESLTLWKSRLYKGAQSLTPRDQAAELLVEMRMKVRCRELTFDEAFWKIYERGWLDHTNDSKEVPHVPA